MFSFFQQFCCYTKREKPVKGTRPQKAPQIMSVQPMKIDPPPNIENIILETDHYFNLDSQQYPQESQMQNEEIYESNQSNFSNPFMIFSSDLVEPTTIQDRDSIPMEQESQEGIQNKPIYKKKRVLKIWDEQEDAQLKIQYEKHNGKWNEIAKHMPGRNVNQCSQRWRRLQPVKIIKRKQWTAEEDEKIMQLVQQYGKNWKMIALHFQGVLSKQIRERYINKIDPDINSDPFSPEEDQIILQDFVQHGCKWSLISSHLKGRPENMVKNRFYSYIRRVHLGVENPYQKVYDESSQEFLSD
ncbi:hypothetical protein pb186bvf_011972 [Paramecium bursaria]